MLPVLVVINALISVPLAWLASRYLLARYRNAIDASMREVAGTELPSALTGALAGPALASPLEIQILSERDTVSLSSAGTALLRQAVEAPRRAGFAYGLAGLTHALIMTALVLGITGAQFGVQRYLVLTLLLAWPAVPCVAHVAVADWRLKIMGPALIALVALLLSGLTMSQFLLLWAILMGVPTVAVLLLGNRSVRAVGPLVLLGVILAVTGSLYAPEVAFVLLPVLRDANVGLMVAVLLFVGISVTAALLFLRWYARRYTEKQESDQVLMMDAWWLLFTIWECSYLASFGGLWGLTGLLAFVGYKIVLSNRLRAAFPDDLPSGGVRLLLLRVFGYRNRTEQLLEEVGRAWRYLGTIHLVAGIDLATYALEPHEFYEYINGRLSRQLVRDASDIGDRLNQLDENPSWDGRYRVQDFVASADAWQAVFQRLAARCDAVLMDLRGFSEKRKGAIYELQHLINWMPLRRIVLLVDGSTKQEDLHRTIQAAWARLDGASPNRNQAATLRMLHVEDQHPGQLRRLLSLLCDGASIRGYSTDVIK